MGTPMERNVLNFIISSFNTRSKRGSLMVEEARRGADFNRVQMSRVGLVI
jgi:hypothetical protein